MVSRSIVMAPRNYVALRGVGFGPGHFPSGPVIQKAELL